MRRGRTGKDLANRTSLVLTDRDQAILHAVSLHGLLTTELTLRRLPVPEAESAERVVEAGAPEPRLRRRQTGLLMTSLAELRRIVAVAAVRLARICGAGVARQEVPRMEAR